MIYLFKFIINQSYLIRPYLIRKLQQKIKFCMQRKIIFWGKGLIKFNKMNRSLRFGELKTQETFCLQRILPKVPKFNFSCLSRNTVPSQNSTEDQKQIELIKQKIESMYLKLDQKELKEMEKIIYPEALLHGQQNISKLSRLYQQMISRFEHHNVDMSGIQQLIKAGDFYAKINVRRLKALRPYQRAKKLLEIRGLNKTREGLEPYNDLCQKLSQLVEEDIEKGQYSSLQQYYLKGLQEQKSGNFLQSLYYYHKGLCISEYRQIPDQFLHFNLLAHYLFLSELVRPRPKHLKHQFFTQALQKLQQLQSIAKKCLEKYYLNSQDSLKAKSFLQTLFWAEINKADIYFKAQKYEQAVNSYQKVIDFYKQSKKPEQRLKIFKVISNLEKSYLKLGLKIKAVSFLQWAHDFVKDQTEGNIILNSRYLKPIDEMLITAYEDCKQQKNWQKYKSRKDAIQKELKEIIA